jgi:hypothetical protein
MVYTVTELIEWQFNELSMSFGYADKKYVNDEMRAAL